MLRWLMMMGLVAGLMAGTAQAEETESTDTPAVEAGEPASPDEGAAADEAAPEGEATDEDQSEDEGAQPE